MQHARTLSLWLLLACVVAWPSTLFAQDRRVDVDTLEVPYDLAELVRPTGLSDAVIRGRAIWVQRCAYCHDGLGAPSYDTLGPWLDAERLESRGEEAFRTMILEGSPAMPAFKYGLREDQVSDLIALLRTITRDHAPTDEQKAGQAAPLGDL